MKTILRSEIPEDFTYYRTGSEVFYQYYRLCSSSNIHIVEEPFGFLKAGRIAFSSYYSVIAEKIDKEPDKQTLQNLGIHHAIVFWSPQRRIQKPEGWFRIPTFFTKQLLHSSRSAFSILDRQDFFEKWSPKARGHLRKVMRYIEDGTIQIKQTDLQTYADFYKKSKIKDPNREYLRYWNEKALQHPAILKKLRVYIISVGGETLAGGVFIDEQKTSEYFTSFYLESGKSYHLGIAMMYRWFSDSLALGIKYCDLDHMRDSGQSIGYKGYTKFKESIADYDVFFHDMWIRFF